MLTPLASIPCVSPSPSSRPASSATSSSGGPTTSLTRAAGIDVRGVELVHLNRDHSHPDANPLLVADDVTHEVEAFIPSIEPEVSAQMAMLGGGLPVVDVGPHCKSPYECPFRARCWPELPATHVRRLHRLGARQLDALEAAGIARIEHIPDSVGLSAINARLRRAVLTGGAVVAPGLLEALAPLEGPVAYLDFETIMPALPVWRGCAPYQQVPVQFSVHRRPSPDPGSALESESFLAEGRDDPRPSLARALLAATEGYETVAAYNAPFEAKCIRNLADAVPELANGLRALAARLVDLLPIVRDHVGHADFGGSFSLKAVAPALLGRGYEGMDVADGATAASLLATYLLTPAALDRDPHDVRASLLAYCERDTEVLAELHQALRDLARGSR